MSQYKEILENLNEGICNYGNDLTEVSYLLSKDGTTKMKFCSNGDFKFFSNLGQMARNINKFLKTGY